MMYNEIPMYGKKPSNYNFILAVGLGIMSTLFFFKQCSSNSRADKESLQLIQALQDTLKHYKNKDSINVASISVIQTQSARDFFNLQLKTKELQELQKVVEEYKKVMKAGSSVTNALIETVATLKGRKPEIKYLPGDTVKIGDVSYVYPTYKDTLHDEWITLDATMGKDTSTFKLKVVNKFSAVVGYKKKKPFVDLLTENPYTTVKSLRTYQVAIPKPKKLGIGFSTGVTLNTNLKPTPYVGVGLNYNILRL